MDQVRRPSALSASTADLLTLARPPTSLDPAHLHPAVVKDAASTEDVVLLSSKRGSPSNADDLASKLGATSVETDTKLVRLRADVDLGAEQGWEALEDAVRDLVDVSETGKSSRPVVLCELKSTGAFVFAG